MAKHNVWYRGLLSINKVRVGASLRQLRSSPTTSTLRAILAEALDWLPYPLMRNQDLFAANLVTHAPELRQGSGRPPPGSFDTITGVLRTAGGGILTGLGAVAEFVGRFLVNYLSGYQPHSCSLAGLFGSLKEPFGQPS